MSTDTNTGHICDYCKGHTHFIDPDSYPNDIYAKEVEPGKWMCGNCCDDVEENIDTVSRRNSPETTLVS